MQDVHVQIGDKKFFGKYYVFLTFEGETYSIPITKKKYQEFLKAGVGTCS
jgi:hypothetical protein